MIDFYPGDRVYIESRGSTGYVVPPSGSAMQTRRVSVVDDEGTYWYAERPEDLKLAFRPLYLHVESEDKLIILNEERIAALDEAALIFEWFDNGDDEALKEDRARAAIFRDMLKGDF
jgi:hypothetical protein